jgi:tetratricopeptide (TPR) repeat protein
MNSFPSVYGKEPLCESDFVRFSLPFSRILKKKIPTVSEIIFLSGSSELLNEDRGSEIGKAVREILLGAKHNPDAVFVRQDGFLLPFSIEGATVVAAVTGVDPFVVDKADPGWLVEVRNSALREFALLKRERIDWDTGLLNAANLNDLLEILSDSADVNLMLIELYPKARSSQEAILNARKSALSLVNFSENRFLIHYLGHGLFALIAENVESISRIGTMLLSWLRREGFARVHIGYSRKPRSEATENTVQSLFDEAWQALQAAGKRGPFSFCDFSLLAHPEVHPLRRPPRKVLARFSRRWKNSNRFSLVQVQSDMALAEEIAIGFGLDDSVARDNNDVYFFLDGMAPRQAREWVRRNILKTKRKIPKDRQFSVGIGHYPFADFSKSEVLYNCRKALLHAAFYGPGSMAVFDALSLNISGDLFYGEGDLENAVREYKRGLVCDKNNVNLLNSLGVAYAMMEKHRPAHHCFNEVLTIDPDNFMALYNLGLGEKFLGMNVSAIARFERALAVHPGDGEDIEVRKDIQFQLGKLYSITGDFQKTIDILQTWYEKEKGTKKAGYACRFLGKSFHELKRDTEAMLWLQRALQFDGFDAEAMGLLGLVYLEQGEGDDIALSLCRKSVEIDPDDLHLRLRLARVLTACGKFNDARNNLRPCLRNKGTRAEAELQNGLICRLEGRSKKASSWFSKVLVRDDAPSPLVKEARYYLEAEENGY